MIKLDMKRLISILSGIILIASSLSSCAVNQEIKEKTFTVTRKNEDGTILEIDSDVKEGELPSFDGSSPSKENDDYYSYYFLGWDKKLEPIYSDITYIAIYDKTELTFTVTWENYDGTILEVDENVKRGTMPEYNGETPLRESDENYKYIFKGWNKVLNPVEENITFKAIFDTTPSIYTVKFLNYDGTLLKEYTNVKFNERPIYLGNLPTKNLFDGKKYEFTGWEPNLKAITDDMTFSAKFENVSEKDFTPLNTRTPTKEEGQVFLFGEVHGDEGEYKEELRIWDYYYNEYGFRDLIVEYSYFFSEILNAYMRIPGDDILNSLFLFLSERTSSIYTVPFYNYVKTLKEKYPETRFHGVNVNEGNKGNAEAFVQIWLQNGLTTEDAYEDFIINLNQNTYHSRLKGREKEAYREEMMAANILKEMSKIGNKSVVGFFGSVHCDIGGSDNIYSDIPNMATNLYKNIGNNLYSENIRRFANGNTREPYKGEIPLPTFDYTSLFKGINDFNIIISRNYNYIYKGETKISYKDYVVRKFYLVENAYNDLKYYAKTGEVLPYNNFPFEVELNQVYAVDFITKDNRIDRKYYRSDPNAYYDGRPTTVCIGEIKSYQSGK